MTFDFREVQSQVRKFWNEQSIYEKAKERNTGKKKFYFLDGPPYTSGRVHLGTAWNKTMKDVAMRFKRMRGFDVWDRAGYDMHGLPTEHATEKELNVYGQKQIENYGKGKFIEACRALCVRNMQEMSKEFQSLGVWMDFDNAYQSITKKFMEGEWWLIKRAHENGRLYEGERAMAWDPHDSTALAKHEIEYKSLNETAIYVRLQIKNESNTYLLIWTTTPWTIPFNLAVMANPEVTYCKVKVSFNEESQSWIMAKELVEDLLTEKLDIKYEIEKEMLGVDIEGMEYLHPFSEENDIYAKLKQKMKKVHTVVLSSEYVETESGTGLVHCAPGCGPEDYEVGHLNGIKPFNTLDEQGVCHDLKPFEGLVAKKEDEKFIEHIKDSGSLIYTHQYTHDYPHGERSHKPVIFRTTKQWFLKVEDMKDKLIAENNKVKWVPKAAYNAFNSWLENLRDNSISRQRYWGTPVPIWRNIEDPDDYIVVGDAKELTKLANLNKEPEDLHSPTVDDILIKKDGKEYARVPDVLDVWIDAGTVSWTCLDYPHREDLFEKFFPADLILEGKDHIRGWFNVLHVAAMVGLERLSFKACFMHGFVNDAQGRKMSKSLGNYILPEEVTEKYGVDATRYYFVGAANPGLDMNYNFDDLEAKFKNLFVFWNIQTYLLNICAANDIKPLSLSEIENLGKEEEYILSSLQTTVKKSTEAYEGYLLNETPGFVEDFLLDLSRTYIQLTREKASVGSEKEKHAVVSVLFHSLKKSMTLLAPVMPYFTEKIYQNLRTEFPNLCTDESVHFLEWPETEKRFTNEQLEKDIVVAKDVIAAIFAARDKAQLGVRWPIGEVRLENAEKKIIDRVQELILYQTNVKKLSFEKVEPELEIKPNYRALGKEFGEETAEVVALLKKNEEKLKVMVKESQESVEIDGKKITMEHIDVTRTAPEPWQFGESGSITAYLDTTRSKELDCEGYAREMTRRIQQLRKDAELVKKDRVTVEIATGDVLLQNAVKKFNSEIAERTGTSKLSLVEKVDDAQQFKIKSAEFSIVIHKDS